MKNLPVETLVTAQGHELKTDSRKVAAAFGKRHTHVIRDIRKIMAQVPDSFAQTIFGLSEYTDKTGRRLPMYEMDKDGFMLLTMGYTTPEAMKIKVAYIQAFNAMRRRLDGISTDLIAGLLAAREAEQRSAALASLAGRVLRERRDEKPFNLIRIAHYERQIQPLLPGLEAV
ncbi:Uncharacterized phage-encoded protein [Kingella potus]|uniref:Uncharacterized phage-encoded protein n=1 Tax=Kingella potus TaxID=265175 RepID=A0A377R509_9NEIS|nr:Rha family transcriptional regulator [Kingella potus]UOP01998.1 Rha family transcriptional regulator [Kingella potus]STR03423.1 Uncharacterized phage-encoded protein [Kingella potus]